MIRKYTYGNPVETGAVIQKLPDETQPFSLMQLDETQDGIRLFLRMAREDAVYGPVDATSLLLSR